MTPVGRWIPLTTEVVEVAVVDLVFSKIRHIALMLAQKTINNEIWGCQGMAASATVNRTLVHAEDSSRLD